MKTHDLIYCDHPRCMNTIRNHCWGKIRADGWFFTKAGKDFCPEHVPVWVEAWRIKNGKPNDPK